MQNTKPVSTGPRRSALSLRRQRAVAAGIATLACLAALALAGAGVARAAMSEVGTFGSAGSEAGQWESPSDIAVDQSTGELYVADTGNDRIDVFDEERNFVMAFGWGVSNGEAKLETCTATCLAGIAGAGAGQLSAPTAIAVDPSNGDVYVVDSANSRVEEFTPAGGFVLAFGEEGSGAGEFDFSANGGSIAVNSKEDVYVADDNRVQAFEATGSYVSELSAENVRRIAVDSAGDLYVDAQENDFAEGNVTEYDESGQVLHELSATHPQAVATDSAGSAYVLEHNVFFPPGLVVRFDSAGSLVEETPVDSLPLKVTAMAFANTAKLLYVLGEDKNTAILLAPPPPPAVQQQWASAVATTSATLNAEVDPEGNQTEYQFEYGTSSSYGQGEAPLQPGTAGSGATGQLVSAHVAGLQPGTVYHYRVAATSASGTNYGADKTFTTFGADEPTALPDGRGYELVSNLPPKNGATLELEGEPYALASENGQQVVLELHTPPAGAVEGLIPTYMASRSLTGSGWTVAPLDPTQPPEVTPKGLGLVGLSADFSAAMIQDNFDLNPEDEAPGSLDLYLREADGSFSWLSRPPAGPKLPAAGDDAEYIGGSADLSTVVWQQEAPLSAADTHTEGYEVYERSGGTTQLVGVLPDGEVPACGAVGGEGAESTHGATYDPLSPVAADGASVVFESPTPGIGCSGPTEVYVRSADTTVQASESQRTTPDPDGVQPADYAGESADGARVFFTSSQELTNDDLGHAPELYEYDTVSGRLTRISSGEEHNATGDVVNVQAIAPSGTYVYFEAEGEPLAPGAVAGAVNLYVYDTEDAKTTFIADSTDKGLPEIGLQGSYNVTTETTPDGKYLLFEDKDNLTGFDQAGYAEVYLYSVESEALICVSCDPSGARPTGPALLPKYRSQSLPAQRAITNDGSRVFFTSPDALAPQAAEGVDHVYEYEDGRVYLISPGRGSEEGAALVGTSASGEDVFFTTPEKLVPRDGEVGDADVYDARIGGGEAESPQRSGCSGEECQGQPLAASAALQAGSSAFAGPGNAKAKPSPKPAQALTRKQKLHRALKACETRYSGHKRRRATCERKARRRFGRAQAVRGAKHRDRRKKRSDRKADRSVNVKRRGESR